MKIKNVFTENKTNEILDIDHWVKKNVSGRKPYIDHDLNTISGSRIQIQTDDTYLPYQILATDETIIIAQHLKTCDNFPIHGISDTTFDMKFYDTHNLDISQLSRYSDSELGNLDFCFIPLLNPQKLKNIPIKILTFENKILNVNTLDINNYVHLQVNMIVLKEAHILGFKNLTTFFDSLSGISKFKIDIDYIKTNDQKKIYIELNKILEKYFNNKTNRNDYGMDATLELIEVGFEDML